MSPVRRVVLVAAYVVPVLVAFVLTVPDAVGLSGRYGFLHLTSFPLVRGAGWVGCAVVLGLAALLVRRRLVVWLAVVAALAGLVDAGTVVGRGFGSGLPAPARDDLTVMAFNTLHGSASPDRIADVVVRQHVDAVALPETDLRMATDIADEISDNGLPMRALGGPSSSTLQSDTSLLVARDLGAYRLVPQPRRYVGATVAEPVDGKGPTIAAIHSPPPFRIAPGDWRLAWQTGATQAVDICRSGHADIVMGDFNSTVDHPAFDDLGRCTDAASAAGNGAEGTWPSSAPPAVAAPIDHVLVGHRQWRAVDTGTARIGGSDHRAVVARLRPVTAPS